MSNASTFLGGGSAIKSVQRGTISSTAYPATATVTAVDTTRSVIRITDLVWGLYGIYYSARVELTNSTTVSMLNAMGSALSGAAVTAGWELVEYAVPIKSIQQVAVTMSSKAQGDLVDTVITAIDLSKTIVEFRGYSGGGENNAANTTGLMLRGYLTSSTNLRVVNRASAITPSGLIGYFTIVEFF